MRRLFNPTGPVNVWPDGSVPCASIGRPRSVSRHRPSTSKFSRPNPSGSILSWQDAHSLFVRCFSNCSRKLRLLDRAVQDGDERALAALDTVVETCFRASPQVTAASQKLKTRLDLR